METTSLHRESPSHIAARSEYRPSSGEQHTVLGIIHLDQIEIFQPKQTQISLAALDISYTHAIHIDGSVSTAHSPEAHGLKARIATKVRNIEPRKPLKRVWKTQS